MASNDFSVEVYKSIIERSGQMVRDCFLMNGGAVVAVLSAEILVEGATWDAPGWQP